MTTIIRNVSYPAMDGIRFYAAFIVVLEHFIGGAAIGWFKIPGAYFNGESPSSWVRFFTWLADGNHGVDVFFLISGILMARIVLHSRNFSYPGFVWSRIKRIYPAFLASLLLCTFVATQILGWAWSPEEFVKNLFFLNAIPDYVQIKYNHVTWSLGCEFAFYLVIPLLLLASRVVDRRVAAALLLVACAVLMFPHLRFIGLFLGALIGSLDDGMLRRFAKRVPLIPVFAAFVAIGVARTMLGFTKEDTYFPMIASAAVLLVKIVWDPDHELARFFSLSWMRWLGTLSYSIYLFHSVAATLVLVVLIRMPATVPWAVCYALAAAALTLLLSWASYMLLERPYFASRTASKSVLHPTLEPAQPVAGAQ